MCEIHHTELRNSRSSNSQREISKKWLNYLIENNIRDRKEIYFNILFVDLDTLQIENFGTQKVHENIYNKFFRTVIHYGVKSFFGNKNVTIKKVFHDKGSMENHGYFPYLNLMKLDLDLGKYGLIEDKEIAFIDSDHRNYLRESNDLLEESHLIQLIDLLIGSITQNIYYLSDDRLKKELAMIVRPLVNRLLESERKGLTILIRSAITVACFTGSGTRTALKKRIKKPFSLTRGMWEHTAGTGFYFTSAGK